MTDQNKDKNQKPGMTKQSQDDKQKKPTQQQAGATKPDAARKPSQKR